MRINPVNLIQAGSSQFTKKSKKGIYYYIIVPATHLQGSQIIQNFKLSILIIFQNIMVLVWAWNNKTFSSNILFAKLNTEWLKRQCVLLFIMAIINVLGKLYACVMSLKFSFFFFKFKLSVKAAVRSKIGCLKRLVKMFELDLKITYTYLQS